MKNKQNIQTDQLVKSTHLHRSLHQHAVESAGGGQQMLAFPLHLADWHLGWELLQGR